MIITNKALFLLLKRKLDTGIIKEASVTIVSDSMAPYISKGDQIKLISTKDVIIKKGDVILYYHWKWATVHRVVDVCIDNNETYFRTKGDNNMSVDEYLVNKKEVIGIVYAVNKCNK